MHTSASAIAESRRPHAGKLSQASLLHQSDERLVALARSGSERAWAEITRRYGRQLRTYCTRFVGPNRAEDAVQQTFLQAFLSLRDGSHREIVLRAWLYRIAHNCSIDLLRKGTADYDELDLEYDGVAQPPTLFEQREEIRGLVARMRDLPDAQRQALALRELEGRSYEEISAQLGHSGSGVRQLIFRARTALRNSAAAILPLGSHQVATAVSVPASSGGGIDVAGAATLAVVAVLGGGLAAADGGSHMARPAQPAGASASPVVPPAQVQAAAPAAAPARAGSPVRLPGGDAPRFVKGLTTTPPVSAPPAAIPAAPPTVAAPIAPAADGAPAPAPGVQAPPSDDVRQQSLTTATSGPPAATSQGAGPGGSPAPAAPTAAKPPVRTSPPGTSAVPPVPAGNGKPSGGTQPAPAKSAPPVSAPVRKPAKPVPAKQTPKGLPQKSTQNQKPLPKNQKPLSKSAAPKVQSPTRTGERG